MKKNLTDTKEDQRKIAKHVQTNEQAIANLTLHQMENEALSDNSDGASVVFDEEQPEFQNVFAKRKHDSRPSTSKQPKQHRDHPKESLPHHCLPVTTQVFQ